MNQYENECRYITYEVVQIINACKNLQKKLHEGREHWDDSYYSGIVDAIIKLTDMLPGKE